LRSLRSSRHRSFALERALTGAEGHADAPTDAARSRAIGMMLFGWTRFLHYRQRERDLAALSAMDDMMLKDIGVNRCQLRRAIRSGTDLKPSC
jgi:uncharacterized protein YjiS (DUF1127 family)